MRRFIRITNGVSTEHYITAINNGLLYYGHYVAGHENKRPTACMTVDYYNKLCVGEQHGIMYPDGCTYGRTIPYITQIIEKAELIT